ncbi:MAG: hypothetical protein ACODAG_10595, partial [Myxococcota bacterium]
MTVGTLVLVDFDNLACEVEGGLPFPVRSPCEHAMWLDVGRPQEWLATDGVAPEGREEGGGRAADCTVVVAMNAVTAAKWGLGWHYLRTLARALGIHLAGSARVRLEVALTLPVPQAADAALLRLCLEAPDPAAAGSVFDVWLLSRDGGLASALGGRLESGGLSREACARAGVHHWVLLGQGVGCVRRFEGGVRATASPTPPVEPRFSVDVDTPGLAAWVASREVDLESGDRELADVARAVLARPGLLSQVGMTRATVRGIERMAALPGPAEIGACRPTDGLEVRM